MKIGTKFCLTLFFTFCLGTSVTWTQMVTGSFRTHSPLNNGNWSSATSWEEYNGSTWDPAQNPPAGSETIFIMPGDSVSVDGAVTLTGTLNDSCRVNIGTSGSLTVGSGGVYNCAKDSGRIPNATWQTGSTCMVSGSLKGAPSNANQNFYNFVWNCPNQSANLNPGWNNNTIYGDVTCSGTGSSGRLQFTAPKTDSTSTVTIMGKIYVRGTASLTAQGTSNGNSTTIMNVHGSIFAKGGNFSVARGSQGGTGTTTWFLYGDTLSLDSTTTQNSNANGAKFVFTKAGVQAVVLHNVIWGTGTAPVNITVDSGTTLNLGSSVLPAVNTGSFKLLAHATLETANAGGIDSTIQCAGASGGGNVFDTTANYSFNGAAAQVTGTMMPATVNDLTINDAAGVTLTQATRINGVLHLKAGVFDNTVPFTLGPSGSISLEGGSLKVTAVKQTVSNIPLHFFVDQNYPNPFNPSTVITYGLPKGSQVTIGIYNILGQEVATLFEGQQSAGVHTLSFDGSKLASGVYLYRVQAGKSVDVKRMVLLK